MRRLLAAALAAFLALGGLFVTEVSGTGSGPARASAPPAGFVYREGRNLMLDGSPYRFVGFNSFGITGCATGTPWRQDQMDAYLAGLPPASMTRTWAFAHFGVERLEPLVARAEAHGQKLILSLANAGEDCGESLKDVAWYRDGYRGAYLSWVRTVVTRFKDSPAIGMWEIMNEPGHHSTVDNATMKAFLDGAAATIKAVDPVHLVTTGSMAEYTPGSTDFELIHSGPHIDVGSLHEYDQDHGDQIISRHLAKTLTPLYRLGKPLIIGETGILAAVGCSTSLQQRADMLRREFDGDFLSGVAGVLVWTYSPNPRNDSTCMYQVRAPDLDPTIALVRDYAMPVPVPVPVPTGSLRLVARHSGKCLTVPNSSTSNGVVLEQRACGTAANQRFTFQPSGEGFHRLVAAHSGKCLDVRSGSYALDTQVLQWDCWGGANQQFRLEPTDSGHYRVIIRHSIQCLRIAGGGTAEGAQLTQFDCKTPTLTSQQYRFG
ncbi:RICIN domain-containing protein [Plantactinospora sp. GCM10030261]|uniref:RICIN domain-containing protein n=1 Tax=Plantactinospora sp. GCM10030261 TaxID=3273420 RepID=UPI0036206457